MNKITCAMMFCLIVPCSGYAQSDWSAVAAIPPGTRLRIEAQRGRHAEGLLQSVDDRQLTLEQKPPAARSEIRTIKRLGNRQTGRFAKRGFVIGALLGGTIGYVTANGNKTAFAGLMFGGYGCLGSIIGAIDGRQSRERMLIYQAP